MFKVLILFLILTVSNANAQQQLPYEQAVMINSISYSMQLQPQVVYQGETLEGQTFEEDLYEGVNLNRGLVDFDNANELDQTLQWEEAIQDVRRHRRGGRYSSYTRRAHRRDSPSAHDTPRRNRCVDGFICVSGYRRGVCVSGLEPC